MSAGLLDSLEVCLIGMTLVGLFLICMIWVMNLSYKITSKYFNKNNVDDNSVIAAIVTVIHNR